MYKEPLLKMDNCEINDPPHLQTAGASTGEEKLDVTLEAIIHQLNSFYAVIWPVTITIVLAR